MDVLHDAQRTRMTNRDVVQLKDVGIFAVDIVARGWQCRTIQDNLGANRDLLPSYLIEEL